MNSRTFLSVIRSTSQVLLLSAVFACSGRGATKSDSPPKQAASSAQTPSASGVPARVSIIQLLARPEVFHNKRVIAAGFLGPERFLFDSSEHAKFFVSAYAIAISPDPCLGTSGVT